MEVWLRMYWILNEFTMGDLNEMILLSVNDLLDSCKYNTDRAEQVFNNINSIFENFEIYFNDLNKFKKREACTND